MIRFGKWVRKSDRMPVARISISHNLDLEELAGILAFAANREINPVEWLEGLSATRAEKSVREMLKYVGYDTITYSEDVEPELRSTALDVAERLWPEGQEGGAR
jgi:hypothetical protein